MPFGRFWNFRSFCSFLLSGKKKAFCIHFSISTSSEWVGSLKSGRFLSVYRNVVQNVCFWWHTGRRYNFFFSVSKDSRKGCGICTWFSFRILKKQKKLFFISFHRYISIFSILDICLSSSQSVCNETQDW